MARLVAGRTGAEAASARNSAVDSVDPEAALVYVRNAGKCPQVKAAVAMSKHTVYIEAPKRRQDLLNIKWALFSAGYSIGSSWHDAEAGAQHLGSEHHWNAKSVEQPSGLCLNAWQLS